MTEFLSFLEVVSRIYLTLVMSVVLSLDFASSPQMSQGKVGVERSQIVWSTCKSWKTKWSFCLIWRMKSVCQSSSLSSWETSWYCNYKLWENKGKEDNPVTSKGKRKIKKEKKQSWMPFFLTFSSFSSFLVETFLVVVTHVWFLLLLLLLLLIACFFMFL